MKGNIKAKWLLFSLTIPMLAPAMVHAEGNSNVSTVSQISQNATNNVVNSGKKVDMGDVDGSNYIPDTTIEDANNWVSKKGDDLVSFGGTLAEPISIIGFMVGLFITLAGGFTKSNLIGKGLLVMAISIIVYAGVVFAPELVQYFSGWLAS